ncbi:hypothetical protein MMC14_003022 [Varicellaria rhodocarpa]|nr:hypothetical protein [Varicellaria rhodocarpa]
MPLYEVQHTVPFSAAQEDAIAKAITKVHTETFTVPRLLVNVRFTDTNFQPHYAAGEKRKVNLIIAYVRTNATRTETAYDHLCASINQSWESIVGTSGAKELRGIIVQGSIIAGSEAGFPIAKAGEDKLWLKQHYAEFKHLAEEGRLDFIAVMAEIEERRDLQEMLNGVEE